MVHFARAVLWAPINMTLAMEFVNFVRTSQQTLITTALPKVPQCVPTNVSRDLNQLLLIQRV